MALEGRLDEFDPDSVEVPDNIINDFEDETYSRYIEMYCARC